MLHSSFISNFKNLLNARIVRVAFLTLLMSGIFLYLVSLIVSRMDSNSHLGRSMSNNPSVYASEADVLILGDTRANQGVDPEVVESEIKSRFGKNIKIYNLGRPGMQIPFAYFLLADYLMKAPKKPKVVIVNFSFYLLGGMQWMEDIYFSYYKPEIWQVLDAVDSKLLTFSKGVSWYITSHIPFLRHKKHFKTVILENLAGELNPMFKAYNWCTFFQNFVVSGSTKGYLSNGSVCVPNDKLSVESYNHYKNTIHNGYSVYTNYLKKFSDLLLRL